MIRTLSQKITLSSSPLLLVMVFIIVKIRPRQRITLGQWQSVLTFCSMGDLESSGLSIYQSLYLLSLLTSLSDLSFNTLKGYFFLAPLNTHILLASLVFSIRIQWLGFKKFVSNHLRLMLRMSFYTQKSLVKYVNDEDAGISVSTDRQRFRADEKKM